jgi:hypothetical protein
MPLLRILLLLCFFYQPMNLFGQKSQIQLENELKKHFQKLEYWNEYHESSDSINGEDSLVFENDFISSSLLQYLKHTTIKKFEYLEIDITSSPDKNINIYSWNSLEGGTQVLENSIVQIKVLDKYFDSILINDESLSFTEIYELINNEKVYYLCVGSGKYSTKDVGQEIRIYTIEENHLKPAKIIKTKSGLTNSLQLGYDFFQLNKQTENVEIKFDDKKQELFIPIALPNGKMTSRYIIYKYNGSYFSKT